MKKKVWINSLTAFAVFLFSLFLVVACKKKEAPPKPTGVSAEVIGNHIRVSWNLVENTDEYCVIKYDEYSMGGIGNTTNNYYDDYDVYNNQWYQYTVTAINSYGTTKSDFSNKCVYSDGILPLPAPTGLSAEVNGSRIFITWNSVADASYYRIRKFSDSFMVEIGTTSDTFFYDSSPHTGQNYYEVTYVTNSGTESSYASVECQYSSGGGGGGGGGGGSAPSAPTGVSAVVSGSSIKVSWNSVSNADEYYVYRSSSSGSGYQQIGTTSSTYYYDDNPGEDNYYKTKAKNSNGTSSYSSYAYCHYSSGGGGGGSTNYAPCPPSVSASGTASSITVSWTKATGTGCGNPTSYKVYKRNPSSGSYELKTTTSSTSYRDTDVHPGYNRYAVEAINDYGSDEGYGYSSEIPLSKPSSFTAQKSGNDHINFSWSKVTQATGYEIFISTSSYGNYTTFQGIDDNVTSLNVYYPGESGHTYYFKLRAYYREGYGSYIYSDFTTYKSVTF